MMLLGGCSWLVSCENCSMVDTKQTFTCFCSHERFLLPTEYQNVQLVPRWCWGLMMTLGMELTLAEKGVNEMAMPSFDVRDMFFPPSVTVAVMSSSTWDFCLFLVFLGLASLSSTTLFFTLLLVPYFLTAGLT